jgi:hypothetical protein
MATKKKGFIRLTPDVRMVMLLEVRSTEGEVGVDVLLQEDAVDESRHPSLGVRAVLRGSTL